MIPKGFLECPNCGAICVFHGAKTAQFAGTVAASLPVVRSQVREARRALYGAHFEKHSTVASLIHRARGLNLHRHKWDTDQTYRLQQSLAGSVRDLPGPRTTSWQAYGKFDKAPACEIGEREERIILVSRIFVNVSSKHADYDAAHHLSSLVNTFDGPISSLHEPVYAGTLTAQEAYARLVDKQREVKASVDDIPDEPGSGAPRLWPLS
jgi:hypothetical protein